MMAPHAMPHRNTVKKRGAPSSSSKGELARGTGPWAAPQYSAVSVRAGPVVGGGALLDEMLERHARDQLQARRREFEKDRLLDELLLRRSASQMAQQQQMLPPRGIPHQYQHHSHHHHHHDPHHQPQTLFEPHPCVEVLSSSSSVDSLHQSGSSANRSNTSPHGPPFSPFHSQFQPHYYGHSNSQHGQHGQHHTYGHATAQAQGNGQFQAQYQPQSVGHHQARDEAPNSTSVNGSSEDRVESQAKTSQKATKERQLEIKKETSHSVEVEVHKSSSSEEDEEIEREVDDLEEEARKPLVHKGSTLSQDSLDNAPFKTLTNEVYKRYDLDGDELLNKYEYGLLMRDIAYDVGPVDKFVTSVPKDRFCLTMSRVRANVLRRLLQAPPIGSLATIEGLVKKPKLNGTRGRVVSVRRDGLVQINCPGGTKHHVPPRNLIWED